MRVLGVSGSLRRDSHNTKLLREAAELLPSGVELVEYDGLRDLPHYDEDAEREPGAEVERWREAVASADALLFATPEYNASIPGTLKNAIDWASRPRANAALKNKPAAVVGASTGMFGAVWAQADLRRVLSTAGARVLDAELPVPGAGDGPLLEDEQREQLATLLEGLLGEAQVRLATAA
jgi:chromate reductase